MYFRLNVDNKNYRQPTPETIFTEKNIDPLVLEQGFFLVDPSPEKYDGSWQTVAISLESMSGKTVPFPDVSGIAGKLFFTDQALQKLLLNNKIHTFFNNDQNGELLEVTFDKDNQIEKGYFYNPIITAESMKIRVDVLEDKFANLIDVNPRDISNDILLFKSEKDLTSIFFHASFKEIIEQNGFLGLTFTELN